MNEKFLDTTSEQYLSRRELMRKAVKGGVAITAASLAAPSFLPTPRAEAQSGTMTQGLDERTQLKSLVDQYLKTKYESRRLLLPQDFGNLVALTPRAQQFVQAERDKREIELLKANLFGLGYAKYNYLLDFTDIQVDTATKEAILKVSEGHDVVYPSAPVVTKVRNIKHTITLQQVGGEWKIVGDAYVDDTRRMMGGASKEQIIDRLRSAKSQGVPSSTDKPASGGGAAPMAVGDWHPYNRWAAIDYASHYYNDRHPAYANYDVYPPPYGGGGDCTNFISQCINNGGAPMDSTGAWVWYYYGPDPPSRSYSWTGVHEVHDYLVNNTWTGPAGVDAWTDGIEVGDLVQIDFHDGNGWRHCPMIDYIASRDGNGIYCTAHSDDCYDQKLNHWAGNSFRFIHITGYRE